MARTKNKTVFVGMSGGVDSSVAAALLKDEGYTVVGVHLKCWNVDGCAENDARDAQRAAETLGIPFYVFDFEKEYRDKVVAYMVAGYRKGITPNPDVMCNQEIKFGLFYQRAMELGADFVATGHYVKRLGDKLYVAKDKDKDQSYFLWTLTKKQIQHCLFPLGNLIKKTEVRRLAKKYHLPNALKKDSQGICFLGEVSLPDFLGGFIPQRPGAIVNAKGQRLGEHKGAYYYTIGQRKGLGIGGSPVPLYVAEKNVKRNQIVLAPKDSGLLIKRSVLLRGTSWTGKKPTGSVMVRIRYRQPVFKAKIVGSKIVFDKPQKFVADGQSAVVYSGRGELLGGGVIQKAY